MQPELLMESTQLRLPVQQSEASVRNSSFPQQGASATVQVPVSGRGNKLVDSQAQYSGRRVRNEPGKPGLRGAPQKVPKNGKKDVKPKGQGGNGRYSQTHNEVTQDHESTLELRLAQGKKVNLNHLLNFTFESRGDQQQSRRGPSYPGHGQQNIHHGRLPKYNKDQFLQANCQFVVKHDVDYSVYLADPDLLVEWTLIEQIRLRGPEVGTCPICLHPPVSAKMTRCGHVYCWPCVLHYLALSDRAWRGCPVCADPIYRKDLKSVISIPHRQFQVGEEIEFRLMRRERDSLLPHFVSQPPAEELGAVRKDRGQKLLLATPQEVAEFVLFREKVELETQLEVEKEQPESCFILEALVLLKDREDQQEASYEVEDVVDISLSDIGKKPLNDSVLSVQNEENVGDKRNRYDSVGSDQLTEHSKDEVSGTGTVSSIGAEDLEFHDYEPPGSEQQEPTTGVRKDFFYFYQATDGQNVYLHGLNAQMLIHEYGSLEKAPRVIRGVIMERDSMAMSADVRNRLRYLRHLPLVTSFEVVELDMGVPLVSRKTINFFHERLAERERRRRRKDRDEKRRERRIQIEEDAKMGRFPKPQLKLDSNLHFPECTRDAYPTENELDPALVAEFATEEQDHQSEGSPLGGSWSMALSGFSQSSGGWGAAAAGDSRSFAQTLRAGKLKPSPSWPVTKRDTVMATLRPKVCDPEDDEPAGFGVEYQAPAAMSLSAALTAALDEASKAHGFAKGPSTETSISNGSKKKKNKSKKLLFSTGF